MGGRGEGVVVGEGRTALFKLQRHGKKNLCLIGPCKC